ncbi:hypothetical protein ES708_20427 [subsurface metagenome]
MISAIFELAQQVLKIDPGNTESLGYLKAAQRRLKASSAPAAFESLGAFETTDLASSRKADREDEEPAGESLAGGVFVGRGKEMGQLKAAIEEALSGGGQLVEPDWVKKRSGDELITCLDCDPSCHWSDDSSQYPCYDHEFYEKYRTTR